VLCVWEYSILNWDAIGAVAELIGALGVIASVIYLAVQIRASTQATRASMHHDLHSETVSRMMLVAQDAALADLLLKSRQASTELTPRDKLQMNMFLLAVFRGFENGYLQHKRGMVEDESFRGTMEALRINAQNPYFPGWWKRNKTVFHSQFAVQMDEILTEHMT